MSSARIPPSSASSNDAENKQSNTPSTVDSHEMDIDSVYGETDKQYISLQETGKGTCGKVTFCIRTPSPTTNSSTPNVIRRSSTLVAVKIPSRQMSRDRIATETIALQRIHSFSADDQHNNVAKHLPILIDSAPIADGGTRWLAVNPIRGFDLQRLRVVVTSILQPSSGPSETRNLPFPAIPEVLVLHIAKQLMETMVWLHNVADISHNDVFGGNVMLDVSASDNASRFTMPTVVLIDFDRASIHPNDGEKGADRTFLYELIHMLDRTGRASSQKVDPIEEDTPSKGPMTWWDVFTSFLAINKGQFLQEGASSFARFRERFGAEIDRRLEDMTEEEEQMVQGLLDIVVEKEVRFPREERIQEVLRQWGDG